MGSVAISGGSSTACKCRACEFQFYFDFSVILWEGSFTSSIDSDSF